MRKTLIALFAVPALAGFAFAANLPTQAVSVTIPAYLSLAITENAALTFDFNSAKANFIPYDSLSIANLLAYQALIDSTTPAATTYFAPTDATATTAPTTVSIHANAGKYNLTATYNGSGEATGDLEVRGGAFSTYTKLTPTSATLYTTSANAKWANPIDMYFKLGLNSDKSFDFSAVPFITTTATITYTLAKF